VWLPKVKSRTADVIGVIRRNTPFMRSDDPD